MLNYILIIAAYLIGAFYLQRFKGPFGPENKGRDYAVSLLLYAVPFIVPVLMISDTLTDVLIYFLFVAVTHNICLIGRGPFEAKKGGLTIFALTNVLNVAMLLMTVYVLFSGSEIYDWVTEALSSAFGDRADFYLYLLLSLLICAAPSSEFVRRVLDHPRLFSAHCEEETGNDEAGLGSAIGICERIIVLILGSMGGYTAIAFVIAAKSLARLEQFKERSFAERFIIGTFSSILIPIILLFIMWQIF
ncbi:MAG: hypothetical protein FWG96_04260 [Methanomassiliicoccaceae archaeon]|nr:hypothetical protein [Methanomassiliicoccaceae archaeon]